MKPKLIRVNLIDYDSWEMCRALGTDCFYEAAEAIIAGGQGGADIFSFNICSPKWLEKRDINVGIFLANTLVIEYLTYNSVELAVNNLINSIEFVNWDIFAINISKYMRWEFDNYSPRDASE